MAPLYNRPYEVRVTRVLPTKGGPTQPKRKNAAGTTGKGGKGGKLERLTPGNKEERNREVGPLKKWRGESSLRTGLTLVRGGLRGKDLKPQTTTKRRKEISFT